MNQKTLLLVLIGAAVVVAAYLIMKKDGGPGTLDDGNIQGIVLAVDVENKLFPLQETTVTGEGEDSLLVDRTFTVTWTDNTTFLLFENAAQIVEDKPTPADSTALKSNTYVMVQGEETEENYVTAKVIKILPGNPRGEPADNPEVTE